MTAVTEPDCRPLRRSDVHATARLHRQHLGQGLFLNLGPKFVRRWHRTFIDNPYGCAHVVTDPDGELLGFILAATDQRRYVGATLGSDKWSLMALGALGLAVRPRLAAHFVRTRGRPYARRLLGLGRRQRAAAPGGTPADDASQAPVAVVHAIVTSEQARGRGVGRRLLAQFETCAAEAGVTRLELVTDADGDAPEFYRRLGWVQTEERLNRDGRRVLLFTKTLSDDAPPQGRTAS